MDLDLRLLNLNKVHAQLKRLYQYQCLIYMSAIDTNGDGELNEDEFISGCLQDKTLANLLNAGDVA